MTLTMNRPARRLNIQVRHLGLALALLLPPVSVAAQGAPAPVPKKAAAPVVPQRTFATPEEAAWALIYAAEQYDVPTLTAILGSDGVDLVVTADSVQDRNTAADFAALARQETRVVRDPKKKKATMIVGPEDWPAPIPIVQVGSKWRFDTKVGRQEILYRRIGRNELDAIDACRGFVTAQREYAYYNRSHGTINQYAQRIISTPGQQDGLVWRDANGALQGPLAEELAQALAEGYTDKTKPYHGYYFKVLKGQGPAAPLGQMDYVVKGAMIGGFALVAAPAEYAVSGVETFIVSQDGVVYQKDLGPKSLEQFRTMTRYNPDATWELVEEP